jgi:hypothetical protein
MPQPADQVEVYLEIGSKKTFAGAIDWPGWIRSGRDEAAALQALLESGPRYGRILRAARIDFHSPEDESAFQVVERLPGNPTTDFGAPDASPSADDDPVDGDRLRFLQDLLKACWGTLEKTARAAAGKELRKGPRGGGREVDGILRHVLGSETSYLSSLGWKVRWDEKKDLYEELHRVQEEAVQALAPAARGELPASGPRGGKRWSPRYYVRRSAWHILDHAWEIEDRVI